MIILIKQTKMKLYFYLPFLLFTIGTVQAEPFFNWTANNIQVLTGGTYDLGPKRRNSITLEHADGWAYGENFAFMNIVDRNDVGTEYYGEFYPRLNWSKFSGKAPSLSLFKDYSLVAGINLGNLPKSDPFKAYLIGAGLAFDIPQMDYFKIDVLAFKSDSVKTTGIQISPVWSVPFQLGRFNFKFKGFADWQSRKATGGASVILAQPQLLLDIGQLAGRKDKVYAGIEYSYWRNKFGIKGLTEKVAQAMIMVTF